MKIAIVYKSLTGNTKLLAETVKESLKRKNIVYFGEPKEGIEADLYIVGSWTDKGMCSEEVEEFFTTLKDKKIAYFATAGFGGAENYYNTLFERVKAIIPPSNEVIDSYFCQGKMPKSLRIRYVALLAEHPEDKKLEVSIRNFDEALSHPNEEDIEKIQSWTKELCNKI